MSKKTLLITVVAGLVWGPLGMAEKAQARSTQSISINDTRIDQNFIQLMEGSKLYGYVPLVRSTYSGVTIAHGFDLGQLSLSQFNRLPIEWSLKNKLQPYVGLKKYTAAAYLKHHPLVITPAESQSLNIAAADLILLPLVKRYNKDSTASFLALPAQAQTVLFSYAYQNGAGFMYRPNNRPLWKSFTTQNWSAASKQLREFTLYKSRRISESRLLGQLKY